MFLNRSILLIWHHWVNHCSTIHLSQLFRAMCTFCCLQIMQNGSQRAHFYILIVQMYCPKPCGIARVLCSITLEELNGHEAPKVSVRAGESNTLHWPVNRGTPKGAAQTLRGEGTEHVLLLALLSVFAVWSLKCLPCQSIHFMKGGEEGLICWGPHTESSPEPCAHPSSQFLDGLGRKGHILDA